MSELTPFTDAELKEAGILTPAEAAASAQVLRDYIRGEAAAAQARWAGVEVLLQAVNSNQVGVIKRRDDEKESSCSWADRVRVRL